MKIKKLYMAFEASAGGIGPSTGVAKDFDYDLVDNALTKMEADIAEIMQTLADPITVTSYSGSAQAEVEAAVDSIRIYLQKMEEPLKKISSKIDEVRNAYAQSEAGIKASLSTIRAGSQSNTNA